MDTPQELLLSSDSSGGTWSAALWDPRTGSSLNTYRNGGAALGTHTLSLLSDSHIIAADATKSRLWLWALNSQAPQANLRLTTPGKVCALACTPDGGLLAAGVGEKMFLWQISTGRLLGLAARHYQTVGVLKFDQDGSRLASGGEDGLVFIWSVVDLAARENCSSASDNRGISPIFSFSDHTLAVKDLEYGKFRTNARLISVSLDRTARIYDSNAGDLLLTLIFDAPLTCVHQDIRECNLFVGTTGGHIVRFNLREPPRGEVVHVATSDVISRDKGLFSVYQVSTSAIHALATSQDCRTLVSGGADARINVWDIESRQVVRTIDGHKGPVSNLLFVPAYDNFRAKSLKSKIVVRPLERFAGETQKNDIIEIAQSRDDSELLDWENYADSDGNCRPIEGTPSTGSADLEASLRQENDFLRAKNQELYRYAVKLITSSSKRKV